MLDDAEALEKLSISRTTFDWGVKLPDGFDSKHVMYVWIDALSNYLTGVDGLALGDAAAAAAGASPDLWPASTHVIGKDIVRFHAIYWPAFLMSAGVPLPKVVFCHGFVLDPKGGKMSKTLGNVVDPNEMLDKYPSDAFRYFCSKDVGPGAVSDHRACVVGRCQLVVGERVAAAQISAQCPSADVTTRLT